MWSEYEKQFLALEKKYGARPKRKMLYHLTSFSRINNIVRTGFNIPKNSKSAFGRGVNLCKNIKYVLKFSCLYSKEKETKILVCEVLLGKGHANKSDDNLVMKNKDGSIYSKPDFIMPNKGYDHMFSEQPYKEIWVVPSARRVYPSFILTLKNQ